MPAAPGQLLLGAEGEAGLPETAASVGECRPRGASPGRHCKDAARKGSFQPREEGAEITGCPLPASLALLPPRPKLARRAPGTWGQPGPGSLDLTCCPGKGTQTLQRRAGERSGGLHGKPRPVGTDALALTARPAQPGPSPSILRNVTAFWWPRAKPETSSQGTECPCTQPCQALV